ncbi:MAG: sterol desaturase family protein [Flavobacteriales bacterium]|nr:sterol desaturase family protein [Flavobacteriales bacterium]
MATGSISDSGRVFQNPVLEALTRTHIAIPLTLFYGSGAAALVYGIVRLGLPILDKKRLALPPLMSVLLAVVFLSIFRALLGEFGWAFGGGFMVGYATYLLAHYAIHIHRPPKNFLNVIWKHHNIHHFVGHEGAFGVSSPFWDYVFGTMPPPPVARRAAQENHI